MNKNTREPSVYTSCTDGLCDSGDRIIMSKYAAEIRAYHRALRKVYLKCCRMKELSVVYEWIRDNFYLLEAEYIDFALHFRSKKRIPASGGIPRVSAAVKKLLDVSDTPMDDEDCSCLLSALCDECFATLTEFFSARGALSSVIIKECADVLMKYEKNAQDDTNEKKGDTPSFCSHRLAPYGIGT